MQSYACNCEAHVTNETMTTYKIVLRRQVEYLLVLKNIREQTVNDKLVRQFLGNLYAVAGARENARNEIVSASYLKAHH
jgi:hypothetical protein